MIPLDREAGGYPKNRPPFPKRNRNHAFLMQLVYTLSQNFSA